MLFRIENFGPIKSFEMDLSKDMHLLYGKNSVGKSYAVEILYLFLKHFEELDIERNFDYNLFIKGGILDQFNKLLKESKKKQVIDITQYIEKDINLFIRKSIFLNNFINGINNTIKLTTNEKGIIKLNIFLGQLIIKCTSSEYEIEFNLKESLFLLSDDSIKSKRFIIENEIEKIIFDSKNLNTFDAIVYFYTNIIGKSIEKNSNTYFLPASRSGLYPLWSSMGSILAWVARHRFGMTETIKVPPLSEPISDYFLNISASKDGEYKAIAEQIEDKIIKGKVILDRSSSKIFFKPNNLLTPIELPQSGSMVSEISPLVTYLKDIMTVKKQNFVINMVAENEVNYGNNKPEKSQKNILIIEEPEAHLHPEAQVELMKIFADMVQNSNIKLILTSHSDYMFAELSNLILGKKIDYQRIAAYHLVMEEGGSVDAKDMEVNEEGILDYNFVDVSEKLYNERMELFEQLNEEVDAH